MGWFLPSHMDFGFIFGMLGLWHTFSILHSYISDPRGFKSRAWYPTPFRGYFRALELWVLLFIVTAFMIKQLSHATEDLASGVILAKHLMRFQHVAFSLMYFVYISVALINETSRFLPLPDGALQGTFALGFLSELIVFHYGHHPGDDLESYVHMLMQLVLGVLVLLVFLEISHPHSVVVASARSMSMVLKGTWFFYIGVLINYPSSIPFGCSILEGHDFPSCQLPEDRMRAKAIQVLIFIVQAVAIVFLTFAGYGALRLLIGETPQNAEYDKVSGAEIEDTTPQVYFAVDKDGVFAEKANAAGVPILNDVPKALSRRMSKRSIDGSTPASTRKSPLVTVDSPLPTNLSLISSPLPKNLKNV